MTAIALAAPVRATFRLPVRRLLGLASPLLFLLIWWAVARAELFPPEILVPPIAVVRAFAELWRSGELAAHLSASLFRLGIGFAAGASAGLAYGCLAALSPGFRAYTATLFVALRTVPSVAFIPIFILIFGIGETFKLLVVAKASFFPVALATSEAVRNVPVRYTEVAAVFRLPLRLRLARVILPATLPAIVTGIRLGLGRSWGVLVAAELVASENGLGQMMEFGRQMFRLDLVMVGVVLAGGIGFAIDRLLRRIEARLQHWRGA